jgi:hypothetical protein
MPVIANGTTSYGEASKRSYIATGVFNTYFYSYTSSRNANNQLVFTLAQNTEATVLNCKAGHVLKENGRKLVYGVNNIDTNTTTTLTTSGNRPYYLVGVFDSSSMLSGFIDPNSPLFAPYSTDLPNFYDRSSSTVTGPDGTTDDMGAPVFTSGSITTTGNLVIGSTSAVGSGKLNVPAVIGLAAGNAIAGRLTLNGATAVTVSTTAVTANSLIFLSRNQTGGTAGFFQVTAQTAGTSFQVTGVALDTSTVNWLIIN